MYIYNMYKRIIALLTPEQRRKGFRMLWSVLVRAALDFVSVAALVPLLLVLLKPGESRSVMLLLCGGVLLLVLVKDALVTWLARMQSRYQLGVYRELSHKLFSAYYQRGLLFLRSKGSVQLSHEVNYACYAFSQYALASLFRICSDGTLVLLMLVALLVWEPLAAALLCFVFLPLVWGYVGLVRKRLRRYGQEELEARRRQARTVSEAFRGYVELEVARAFDASQAAFAQGTGAIADCRLRTETCQLFPMFLSEVAVVLGLALLVLAGRGDLGLAGGVFAVVAFRLIPAVRGVLNAWTSLQNVARTLDVIEEDLAMEESAEAAQAETFTFNDRMTLRGLSFAFPDGHRLFRGLDWDICRGERVGIRGASGAGKSTLFNLMLGFLAPTEGEIRIDGKRLTTANRSGWHRLVGYVPQEIFIKDGTLAENVALGSAVPDRKKLEEVLELVHLGDWLRTLPQGVDTDLGECGSRLSGGQKQRIGIARALYKDAEVLFLDEATSALDNRTEQEVNRTLQSLSEQRRELTIIIIAHRESSLAVCGRVLDLNQEK